MARVEKRRKQKAAWRKANPEKCRAYTAKWNKANPEYTRAWLAEHPGRLRASWLQRTYGLTLDQYKVLDEAQNGKCGICGQPESRLIRGRIGPLVVDHDHVTGRVRGLLCHACNVGIGFLGDSKERVGAAYRWLERD